jgi:hypothetical protein
MPIYRRRRCCSLLTVLIVSTAISACASADYPTIRTSNPMLPTRAVFLNRHGVGVPVRLVGQSDPITRSEYDDHLHRMMESLRGDRQPHGVMIVVHGGMNGFGASRELAEAAGDSIHAAGYNPVFINWRTDALNSYGEHLVWTRRGHVVSGSSAVVNPPLNLVADLGRGVTRWPLNLPESVRDEILTFGHDRSHAVVAEYDTVRAGFGDPAQVQVSLGAYCQSTTGRAATVLRAPFFPFRLALGVPISETVGTSGWNNMLRRTRNVFRQPVESAHQDTAYGYRYRPGQGGVSILMDSLERMIGEESVATGRRRPIILIGHSMGAIVLNEVIRRYPAMTFDTIVYMASAASSRDVYDAILPYLGAHKDTRFYSLTLHPNADAREHMFFPLLPVGSLLEAIDDIYQNPLTHVDRTFGKWTNAMETLHLVPDSVRGQITIKAFGYNDPDGPVNGPNGRTPRRHGDFNDLDIGFWRSSFWQATPPPTAGESQPESCERMSDGRG